MNKHVLYSLALAALSGHAGPALAQEAPEKVDKRPNIILFLVDDMGWQDTSLPFWTEKTYYNSVYETPNMERLARQGMMFTQAYACPLSSATRCSLITGANNVRHRVTNWTLEKISRPTVPARPCNCPTGIITGYLRCRVRTIPMWGLRL